MTRTTDRTRRELLLTAIASALLATTARAHAGNSYTPIDDLGTGLYLNQYQGGLYPGGSNARPAAHFAAGSVRSGNVQPLNVNGQPDPTGKFVMLSIGMSNTSQEWAGVDAPLTFQPYSLMGQAAAHPAVNHSTMVLFNGARGGQTASTWDQPTDANYARVANELTQNGLSQLQVRAAWVKVANAQPSNSLPAANADANILVSQMGDIVRSMKQRYPNLEMVFFSSRIYAGYATTPLNPEPYAYESGFAVKRVVQAQVNQMSGGGIDPLAGDMSYGAGGPAPWVAWGPYLWADGANPRGTDGLTWLPGDFAADGTHPSVSGRTKVGRLLMRHFVNSPLVHDWFLNYRQGDANTDGTINFDDYVLTDNGYNHQLTGWRNGDFNYDDQVNFDDYVLIDLNFNTQESTLGRAVSYLSGDDRSANGMNLLPLRMVMDHYAMFGNDYARGFLSSVPDPVGSFGAAALCAAALARRSRLHRAKSMHDEDLAR